MQVDIFIMEIDLHQKGKQKNEGDSRWSSSVLRTAKTLTEPAAMRLTELLIKDSNLSIIG
jgi:hypothetical protein